MKAVLNPDRTTHRARVGGAGAALIMGASVILAAGTAGAEPIGDSGADPITIGHRGSAGLAPENTVSGIELAHEHAPEFIEIDVQLSADGVPVMMHDTTLTRTTDAEDVLPDRSSDLISSFTYDELLQLDAGTWYSDTFAG